MSKTVAVLMGGWSSEREVSLVSGEGCAKALEEQGYNVARIDVKRDLKELLANIEKAKPDVIFNALHGTWGEDGCIQGVLEVIGIPYTHSGPLASALAMDKNKAKEILAYAGVPSPKGKMVKMEDLKAGKFPFAKPFVIKPNNDGSSCGVYIVKEDKDIPDFAEWHFGGSALVEEYIPGRELSIGVANMHGDDPHAFTVTEIKTNRNFYDYEAKYSNGGSYHEVPAQIPSDVFVRAIELAEIAHKKLGCSGVSRADFRYNEKEGVAGLFLLEVNTQPGMTPTSLVPEQAAYSKVSYGELVKFLVEKAKLHN